MFQFFTYGGKQYWEDVFFYQKWRIQRHYKRKNFRLLDNWDICRAKGGFETCRKAFVKYIEACEIPRQSGEMVIMLHGLGQTKSMFRPIWRRLTGAGYHVAALNYPSTKKSMRKHLQQLNFFLSHCEDIHTVSFITYGSGALLLRRLLTETDDWKENFRLGRIININPTNCGSDLYEILSRYTVFNKIFGPMLKECSTSKAKGVAKIPHTSELGLIFCQTLVERILQPFRKRLEGAPINEETESSYSKEILKIGSTRLFVLQNRKIGLACLKFLQTGKFK